MSFWSGLEAFTGHKPGAFTGMTMKDLFDKDMWEIRERLNQGRRFEETGIKDTTALYKGMGKPGMFGDVTRPYGGAGGQTPTLTPTPTPTPTPQPSSTALMKQNEMAAAYSAMPAQAQTRALPPRQPLEQWPTFDNPYRRPATLMNLPAGGRQRVPSLYDPYLSGLRSDQMGAAGFNPLERRMHESRVGQQGLTIAGQYRKGLQDAVGTFGDAFLPEGVMKKGREVWGGLRDFYYPDEDKTVVVTESEDPNIPTQRKTTIKGKVDDRDDKLRRMMNQYRGY